MGGARGSVVPVQPHTNLGGFPVCNMKQPINQSHNVLESPWKAETTYIRSLLKELLSLQIFSSPKTKAAMTLKVDF